MGSSSNSVNFSVRPNKAIERSIIFEGLRKLIAASGQDDWVYIGLGSAWFVDFEHAHRHLGISTMISIEGDDITFKRAEFNRPFRTVELIHGMSHDEIPILLATRDDLMSKPWIVWLDYDEKMDETKLDELKYLVSRLPENSILLTTYNAHPKSYGVERQDRLEELQRLFGDAFPHERFPEGAGLTRPPAFQSIVSQAALDTLNSESRTTARPGGFVSGFNLHYQDGSPMVTVGGILPDEEVADAISRVVSGPSWRGFTAEPIVSPPLTAKEIAALRTLLPSDVAPSRADLVALGFDLKPENLDSFVKYYLEYPQYYQAAR